MGSLGVHSTGIGASDGVHSTLSHDGIFASSHLLDEAIGVFFATLHQESERDAQSSDDLLVLRVSSVGHHLLDRSLVGASEHNHTHRVGGSLADRGRVSVGIERVLKLLIDFLVSCGHGNKTETKGDTVLDGFDLTCVLVTLHEEFVCLRGEVVGVDETMGVVSTSCTVGRVVGACATCKVRHQDLVSLALVSVMDHTE